jgi:hypothetical protein
MIARMDAHSPHTSQIDIDDRFLSDWVEFGMDELTAYLGKHARFDAYCERRDGNAG